MLLSILVFSMIALLINAGWSEKALKESYLKQAEITLQKNVDTMASSFYETYMLPSSVETMECYEHLRSLRMDSLPERYIAVLNLINTSLKRQSILYTQCEECVLFYSNVNAITSKGRSFCRAEDCFSDYMRFSETDPEELMRIMNRNGGITLLPIQKISIGTQEGDYLPLVISPKTAETTVMRLYSEATVLDYLGMNGMPEGVGIQIEDNAGKILLSWPYEPEAAEQERFHSVKVENRTFHFSVTMCVPEDYFREQLFASRLAMWLCVLLDAVLGAAICLLLSNRAAKPWRDLLEDYKHPDTGRTMQAAKNKSEVSYLSSVLESWQNRADGLHNMLLSSILIRALSGTTLMRSEEEQLTEYLRIIDWPCRLALIHSDESAELLLDEIRKLPLRDFLYHPVSMREIGILFPDGEENLRELRQFLTELVAAHANAKLLCGISLPAESVAQLQQAVSQARAVMPRESGVGIYATGGAGRYALSWVSYESIYQRLLAADEPAAVEQLHRIAQEPYRGFSAREAFFTLCFVLRSVAEQHECPFPELDTLVYHSSDLARENILRLEPMIHTLIHNMLRKQEQQREQRSNSLRTEIIDYIKTNFPDSGLCAASMGVVFQCSEKRVYNEVRQASGKSFGEYLTELRMEHAKKLLCTTNAAPAEIAECCGYYAVNSFYRAFKNYTGVSPLQYRKSGERA